MLNISFAESNVTPVLGPGRLDQYGDPEILEGIPVKIVVKNGPLAIALFLLVPSLTYCQEDLQPELPQLEPPPSNFINDVLQPSETSPETSMQQENSPENPYESRLKNPFGTESPESLEISPFGPQQLLGASVFETGSNLLSPPQLVPSFVRQSIARTWEGREPNSAPARYNFRIGNVGLRLGFGLGIEANDNIFASENNRQSDMIFTPRMEISTSLKLSDLNTIQLSLGVGYNAYMLHPSQNSSTVSPGSQIAFTIYAGNFRIQLHEQFSLEQDPTSQPSLNNVANAGVFTNTIGGLVTCDLNEMILNLGYDHTNTISTQSNASYPAQTGDSFSLSSLFAINPSVKAGPESTLSFTRYSETGNMQLNNSTQVQLGAFVQWRLTSVINVQANGGFDEFFFDQAGSGGVPSQVAGWYGSLTLNQALNSHISQSISLGRETSGGLNSSFEQIDYLRHTTSWSINDKMEIESVLYAGRTAESAGTSPKETTQYGGGLTVSWRLGQKISLSSQYRYIYETSNQTGLGYTQNQLLLFLDYHF